MDKKKIDKTFTGEFELIDPADLDKGIHKVIYGKRLKSLLFNKRYIMKMEKLIRKEKIVKKVSQLLNEPKKADQKIKSDYYKKTWPKYSRMSFKDCELLFMLSSMGWLMDYKIAKARKARILERYNEIKKQIHGTRYKQILRYP